MNLLVVISETLIRDTVVYSASSSPIFLFLIVFLLKLPLICFSHFSASIKTNLLSGWASLTAVDCRVRVVIGSLIQFRVGLKLCLVFGPGLD